MHGGKQFSDFIQRSALGRNLWSRYVQCTSGFDGQHRAPVYREATKLLEEYEYAPLEQIKIVQEAYLKKTIDIARQGTDYYKQILPHPFRSADDMTAIPFLTKTIVRNNLHRMLRYNIEDKSLVSVHTSGSTSEPLSLFWDRDRTDDWESAFVHHYLMWHKVPKNGRRLRIGALIHANDVGYKFHRPNTLSISSDAYEAKKLDGLCSAISKFKPQFIHALPSNLYLFINVLIENNLRLNIQPKVIFTSSEKLHPRQRTLFANYFNAPIMDLYGNTERTNSIIECEAGQYHVNPLYSYTEIINEQGEECGIGEEGEVVGTTFNNYVMPLIRYRTGDKAKYANGTCTCGRMWPVVSEIMGKDADYIVTRGNKLVSVNTLWGLHLDFGQHVVEFELEQFVPGIVEMTVSTLQHCADEELVGLKDAVNQIKGVEFIIRQSGIKPKTGRRKYTMLKQHILSK
jgi:phenylacetate-CoA ligase